MPEPTGADTSNFFWAALVGLATFSGFLVKWVLDKIGGGVTDRQIKTQEALDKLRHDDARQMRSLINEVVTSAMDVVYEAGKLKERVKAESAYEEDDLVREMSDLRSSLERLDTSIRSSSAYRTYRDRHPGGVDDPTTQL